jgi:hypothetical protein
MIGKTSEPLRFQWRSNLVERSWNKFFAAFLQKIVFNIGQVRDGLEGTDAKKFSSENDIT